MLSIRYSQVSITQNKTIAQIITQAFLVEANFTHKGVRDEVKKKTCIFEDIVPIEFTLPPSKPNQDIFKLGHFRTLLPLPPLLQLGQFAFQIFFGHEFQERKLWICVYFCTYLSVTLLILALLELYRRFQRVLELWRELEKMFFRDLN